LEGIKENMKVILIGYRAAGKTTVGKLLAMLLKVPFYDSDSVVEEIVNAPVKSIVAHNGWDFFREKETEAIRSLSGKGNCVIATGGGVILSAENVKLLKQSGVIVWLNAPIKDIIDRLNEDAQKNVARPQFTTDDLAQETINILAERMPLYKKTANFMVSTAGKSAPQIAETIYRYLLGSGNIAKLKESKNKTGNLPIA
jgi:shikimate kinase